ncbi:MAG TPA: M56 family metallopeptidase [Vicinamibacterales bacterium]|nr:M56 family metallopeptidase [Vicinamibacterales bacterium]
MGRMLAANLLAWWAQVGVLALAAGALARLVPIDSAAVRHAWWRVVLLLCLLLPLVQPWHAPRPLLPDVPATDAGLTVTVVANASRLVRPLREAVTGAQADWWAAGVFVLAAGALLRFAWIAVGLARLRRLRGAGLRIESAPWTRQLQSVVRVAPEIRYAAGLSQPVTFGVRRPVILLPATLRSRPAHIQQAVLAHELWHVRRRDWLFVLIEECLRAVLWFHPGIWWLVSRVQASREEVVDELTVLVTNARRSYLEALLAFADEPVLAGTSPFARRRHLFERMLLISKEAVMSSRRIVASCAVMLTALAGAGWYGAGAFPLVAHSQGLVQSPPRDHRPGAARPASSRELELQTALASEASVATFIELARLQEDRGALAEAEATLLALRQAHPQKAESYHVLARFYGRAGQADRAAAALEDAAALNPSDPRGHQVVATFYEEAVRKGTLTPAERAAYIALGIRAADRALAADPDFVDALVYKNILLRHQAATETDAPRKQALIAEADALRSRAFELRPPPPPPPAPAAGARGTTAPPPPPPPPPPGGREPVRVGGTIRPPTKIKDARPVYPDDAKAAGIHGVVILEALINESGGVIWTRVLRSVPMLDKAAIDAVTQWEFAPTLLNGEPVPVIMTVTVNFTLQ